MESYQTKDSPSLKRIAYWDVAKSIAIFCVVWGHCLQNMTEDPYYWLTDSLCQFIYSFHMPLFMIISGYFAYNSLNRPIHVTLLKKVRQLILPSISWYVVIAFIAMIFHKDFRLERVGDIFMGLPYSLWFLKSLFMCYLITIVGVWLYRWRRWVIGLFALAIFGMGEWLNYVSVISMLPFFISGVILHYFEKPIFYNSKSIASLCAIVFVSAFMTWESSEYNLYLNSYIHGGYNAFIIRYLIGLSGSALLLLLIRIVLDNNGLPFQSTIAGIGTLTLGIYCIQVLLAEGLCKTFASHVDVINPFKDVAYRHLFYDYFITPFASVVTICVCCLIIAILKKNRILRLIFLGES